MGSIKAAWIAPRKPVRKCHWEDRSSVHPSYETGSGYPLWLSDQKGLRGPCGGQNTGAVTLGWGLGPGITSSPALPLQAGATSMTEPQNPPLLWARHSVRIKRGGQRFLTTSHLLGSHCNETIKAWFRPRVTSVWERSQNKNQNMGVPERPG